MKVKFIFKKHILMVKNIKRYSVTTKSIILYYTYGGHTTIGSEDLQAILPMEDDERKNYCNTEDTSFTLTLFKERG